MKLLEQVRQQLRVQHLALSTERSYLAWIEQFIRFLKTADGWRHPKDVAVPEVEAFLTHLAVQRRVSASTQNQALSAILFLYRDVLKIDLGDLNAVRAHRTRHVPVVLTPAEAAALLAAVDRIDTREPYGVIARLMYGAGLRVMECCRIRVKDVDFARNQITIRQGKGGKDRPVMLPQAVREELARILTWREELHKRDLARNQGVDLSARCARRQVPQRRGNSAGNSSSRPDNSPRTRAAATLAGTTSFRGPSSAPSARPIR
jgi:site-specific recombinase XerD